MHKRHPTVNLHSVQTVKFCSSTYKTLPKSFGQTHQNEYLLFSFHFMHQVSCSRMSSVVLKTHVKLCVTVKPFFSRALYFANFASLASSRK